MLSANAKPHVVDAITRSPAMRVRLAPTREASEAAGSAARRVPNVKAAVRNPDCDFDS